MKPFTTLAVVLFALIAGLHAVRLVMGWKVIVGEQVMALGGTSIPMWVSYIGIVLPVVLAAMLWRESK